MGWFFSGGTFSSGGAWFRLSVLHVSGGYDRQEMVLGKRREKNVENK